MCFLCSVFLGFLVRFRGFGDFYEGICGWRSRIPSCMADGEEQARVVNVDPSFANAALNSDAFYYSEEYMTAQIEFVATQDEDCSGGGSGTRAEAMETDDEDEESQHAPSVKRLSLEIRDGRSFPKFSPGMLSAVPPSCAPQCKSPVHFSGFWRENRCCGVSEHFVASDKFCRDREH